MSMPFPISSPGGDSTPDRRMPHLNKWVADPDIPSHPEWLMKTYYLFLSSGHYCLPHKCSLHVLLADSDAQLLTSADHASEGVRNPNSASNQFRIWSGMDTRVNTSLPTPFPATLHTSIARESPFIRIANRKCLVYFSFSKFLFKFQ